MNILHKQNCLVIGKKYVSYRNLSSCPWLFPIASGLSPILQKFDLDYCCYFTLVSGCVLPNLCLYFILFKLCTDILHCSFYTAFYGCDLWVEYFHLIYMNVTKIMFINKCLQPRGYQFSNKCRCNISKIFISIIKIKYVQGNQSISFIT